MGVLVTLAAKDLRLLIRDRVAVFWVVAFPLLFALFFGAVFGSSSGSRGNMAITVVDEANSAASREFIARLQASDALTVDTTDALPAAEALVRRGKRVAYLRIAVGFSDGPAALFAPSGAPTIELGVDPTRTAERGMLVGVVTQGLFSGMIAQFSDPAKMLGQLTTMRVDLDASTGVPPAQKEALRRLFGAWADFSKHADAAAAGVATPKAPGAGLVATKEVGRDHTGTPRSAFQITFASAIVWGLMGCATTFAASLVRERTMGTLLRLRVAPIGRAQLLAGKALACFIAGLGVSVFLLTIGVVALGVRIGSPALLLVTLPCAAACFTGVMMLLSVLGRTEAAVAGGSWVLVMPLAMLGGGMIPLVAMPQWMLAASNISPFKWAIFAIEGAIWRDLSLAELALPIAVLLGLAAGLFGLGVMLFRRHWP